MASQREPDYEAEQDDLIQYSHGSMTMDELDLKYGGDNGKRPRNHSKTPLFKELLVSLFDPLNDMKTRPTGPKVARKKQGPHGPSNLSPHEQRQNIISRFISRWRNDVGNDFYPALRLILPEKDRDRPMYGLKEKAMGKLIVKMLKISPDSDAGRSLLDWKLPGRTTATRMAGDFAGRCYEALSPRTRRTGFGDMRIAEVNELLDKLAAVSKEEEQLPIFEEFYNRMNAEELQWLIRIILRQMKVGATEKTFLNVWHPDGEALFNVSSSLRRVCWDLVDPEINLEAEKRGISLMECFQPQLAQFQMKTIPQMIIKMGCTDKDKEFWVEEKLDGERMQLHMESDPSIKGGRRFGFWSRKGKDYTYLYGNGLEDENSSLTRFLKDAFDPELENIILDGEMITWDPNTNAMVGFGSLKTAAISEQRNPYGGSGHRPLLRVFDCLYVNGQDITYYTLRDRRNALERSVRNVEMRLEIHKYQVAKEAKLVEDELHRVIAEASEGLVLKNPRSLYRLNSRNDDWMKVKPEYMTEFGESLDCVVIGGFYGSGHRGGTLSSFLCGLRVDDNRVKAGDDPMKCLSFFKVGGGFRAEDYARIYHKTEGKWIDWDRNNPPNDLIVLGGGEKQAERPDVWIKPCDSVVLEVKAASVGASDQYGFRYSLRFPRFKKLRDDKTWREALSTYEFIELKNRVEEESSKNKELKVDMSRRATKRQKKELVIAGNDSKIRTPYAGPQTKAFENLTFCVTEGMVQQPKKSKAELEQIIKSNGGNIIQKPTEEGIVVIGDKRVVSVVSLIKKNQTNIVKPIWLLDALKQVEIDGPERQRFLIPFEPTHMFHMLPHIRENVEGAIDDYGDSYARDVSVDDLKRIIDNMIHPKNSEFSAPNFLFELGERGKGFDDLPGSMFRRCVARFVPAGDDEEGSSVDLQIAKSQFLFAGGTVAEGDDDDTITHFVLADSSSEQVKALREKISRKRGRIPRIVSLRWLSESWAEKTLLDGEQFAVIA
ncbi:related to DNA ligase 4 [Phialocephala subalpina]|uniref:DNA ligase n=1 Tax=Phialocephala subalpina TaxID=576137 RepID=A0A1L7WX69_9HELO|nr:related to DNA ligase 4 [Phialocephala subalpina]